MTHFIVILLYLFTLIGIGLYKANKIKTQSDFSVAGRSLTPWVLVGTMLATWMGTGSILGNAGKTYETGLAALILPLGSVLGIIILTQIAGKVRSYEKFTVPEILGDRFGQSARIISVIALVIAYMVIVSYQYNAGGAVLSTILTDGQGQSLISVETGTIIAAVFIVLYTMLAGLVSVAYTDVANGIIILFSFIIAIPIFLYEAGGVSDDISKLNQNLRPSYGLGFRAIISSLIYRFDLAVGDDGLAPTIFINYPLSLGSLGS